MTRVHTCTRVFARVKVVCNGALMIHATTCLINSNSKKKLDDTRGRHVSP